MNYYAARRLEDGPNEGKWHYTCFNRRIGTWPVAGCSPHEKCPNDCRPTTLREEGPYVCEVCKDTGSVLKGDPCPGHDTAEEACEHARQYALDAARYDAGEWSGALFDCEVPACEVFTNGYAVLGHRPVGPRNVTLCPKHMNREGLERVFPRGSVGQITSSY